MTVLGNILWLVLGGLIVGIATIIGGIGLCLTIVGIPFGVQQMKLGIATLAPFGKEVVEHRRVNSPLRVVFNVIWLIFFGWEIALAHLLAAIVLFITILGIPFALQHIKLIPLALVPFGRDLQPIERDESS